MAASAIETCPVCLERFGDARVLPCLHSVCRTCIDKMAVTSTDGVISCSLCRMSVTLPPNGGAGLPKDVSVSKLQTRGECGMCNDDQTRTMSSAICQTCLLPLRAGHTSTNNLETSCHGGDHYMDLNIAKESSHPDHRSTDSQSSTPPCSIHGEALKYHCGTCDEAICADCAVIGDHKHHKNIRPLKDHLDDRKKEVNEKIDTLQEDVLQRLERSLQAVDAVSTQLTNQADRVRADIRQAGKRAVEMVGAQVEQMVQDVDDLELSRFKVLDRQRDQLQSHLDAAKHALRFRDRVMKQSDTEAEAQLSVLDALDVRTTNLTSMHIDEQPQHHSRILFSATKDEDLASKAKQSIGNVLPSQAAAKYSLIYRGTSRKVLKDNPMSICIRANNMRGYDGRTSGGDAITTRCFALQATDDKPSTKVTDHNNGNYTVTMQCSSTGMFRVEVYINGEKMADDVTVTCFTYTPGFDPLESHPTVEISDDRRKARLPNVFCLGSRSGVWKSILGISPMSSGQYTWKVKIGMFPTYYMLGVAQKPLSAQREDDYWTVANVFHTSPGVYLRSGVVNSGRFSLPSEGDTYRLDLDCDRHTLKFTNLTYPDETVTFSKLPAVEYYQFYSLSQRESSLEIID